MINADKFEQVFGIYATELWAKPEKEFLEWLNSEAQEVKDISIPSAERTGKWIDIDPQSYTWKCRCPECGHERSMMSTQGNHPKFCENCGLRLK